jgi:methionine synthase II (cobalamin-independent)
VDRSNALDLLPPCATTGIGSLPHLRLDEAVALSMQQDVPYLPELPRLSPRELMLSEEPRAATVAFLAAVAGRVRVAKTQLVGPLTARAHGGPDLAERVAARAASMAREFASAGVTPLLFLDEPALGTGEPPVAALEHVRRAARDAGAIVGLHCCGQARWGELLALDFEVISLDARLSLDALLEHRDAWLSFLARGGRLCLGIVPTNPGARYSVDELCDSVEASLRATTPRFEQVLSRTLLSPACGLGLHSVEDAARISAEVKAAQARLRALL